MIENINYKKLFWMVMIAAKEYQPSIILIEDF